MRRVDLAPAGAEGGAVDAAGAPRARVPGSVVEAEEEPGKREGGAVTAAFAHGPHLSRPVGRLLPEALACDADRRGRGGLAGAAV